MGRGGETDGSGADHGNREGMTGTGGVGHG
jgi:hypothetical protein